MTTRRNLLSLCAAAALSLGVSAPANAAEFEYNLQSFLPAQATVPRAIIDVWADKLEAASGDRIKINRFPSMQLGGKPPELIDQVIDGVVDMSWTVVGYTPGRFPSTEVFELPFIVTDSRAASSAYWQMMKTHMEDSEFKDVKVLGTWVHGPGRIHSNKAVSTPADFNGMKIRGASRQVNALLKTLGATPVGMPVPAVPEALSKGVIDGTTIPWEVTKALKVPELVENHTEFTGPYFYTVTFVLAMNKAKWNALPDDLKKIVDDNSGLEFSVFAADVMTVADGPARQIAADRGNNIVTLDEAQSAAWAAAAAPVYDAWLAEMSDKGIDGQALIDEAKSLMADYR